MVRLAALILAVSLCSLAHAQNTDGPTDDPSLNQMISAIGYTHAEGDVILARLSERAREVIDATRGWILEIRTVLIRESGGLYFAILLPVLIAESAFVGFRVMLRQPIVEQLLRLTLVTFIFVCVSLVIRGNGQTNVFNYASENLGNAGRSIGGMILRAGMTSDSRHNPRLSAIADDSLRADRQGLLEPPGYWYAWIGPPPDLRSSEAGTSGSLRGEYKYGIPSIMGRIWNDREPMKSLQPIKPGPQGFDLHKTLGTLVQQAIFLFLPFQLIGIVFAIAQFQLAGFLTVLFGYLAILVGSIVALDVSIALCVATLPLMYFRSFEQIWSQILTVLTGLALIPCLYYIFSALGFVFVDHLFNALFPPITADDPGAGSFAMLINSVFVTCIVQVFGNVNNLLGEITSAAGSGLASVFALFFFLGKLLFGSIIITTLLGGGVAFAAAAPGLAFRWRQGFASEDLFARVQESLLNLQSTLGNSLGSLYADALGGATRQIGRAVSSLGKPR